jgi:hypothetical protein
LDKSLNRDRAAQPMASSAKPVPPELERPAVFIRTAGQRSIS